jgi:hypothetical protein
MNQVQPMIKVNWHNEGLEGDNNGYIHGLYFVNDDYVEDVMWFETEEERDEEYINTYGID